MVDVLLVQPPIRDFYLTAKRTIPCGLLSMAAALRQAGFSVQLFDALASRKVRPLELPPEMAHLAPHFGRPDLSPFALFHGFKHFGYSYEHLGNVAAASRARLVGISSLFTPYAAEALEAARTVKRRLPGCVTVMGGHHATSFAAEVVADEAVDYVIRGEGEDVLPRLADAVCRGRHPGELPGLVQSDECKQPVDSDAAWVRNLDRLPLPDFDFADHRFYRRKEGAAWMLAASRGCPLACSYCALGGNWPPYRRRSVSHVLAEIETAVRRFGVRFIDFEDEHLSRDRKWFLELLAGIETLGSGLTLRAMNGLYPLSLDETVIAAMRRAGFRELNLSLGTTSRDQLRRFSRADVSAAFDYAVRVARRLGMSSVGYIIVGAPGQPASDSLSDLFYLARRPVLAGVSVFYPAPGSRLYRELENTGQLPAAPSLLRSTALPVGDDARRLEAVTLLRLGRILNFMKRLAQEKGRSLSATASTGAGIPGSRESVGKELLERFLADGAIRGISPEGEVFQHPADENLCRLFLEGVRQAGVVPVGWDFFTS
jgi:anaerobic magnesium-protoporphyrin IX monomethyl ester cyclase